MSWFRGVRLRMFILVTVSLFGIIGLGAANLWFASKTEQAMKEVTEVRLPSIQGLEQMNEGQSATALRLSLALFEKDENIRRSQMNLVRSKLNQIKTGRA